jgi:trans-aconitate methyltransferase
VTAAPIRYVTDVPYIVDFTPELSPDWLDLVATIGGFTAPRQHRRFAWCELGCGQGLTANIYAAANPEATFVGIDAMPEHIAAARALSAAAGTSNLTFHALDFETAICLDLPPLQYIVAHGVYAWIDAAAAASLRRFVKRHLAPGGLVYVSYNAMPGWAADAPFQHLVGALAASHSGDSNSRFASAAEAVRRLTAAGAPALRASPIASDWDRYATSRAPAYFAHEYLAPAWRALYVDEVRAEMASIGLVPVGSATLVENFDKLVLRQAAREALRAIEDNDLRELARDYFLSQTFRRDVFALSPRPLSQAEQRERLLASPFALLRPASLTAFTIQTEAGRVDFDNAVARRLVALLADGPRRLADCLADGDAGKDVVANALILCCARVLWPATETPASTNQLNEALLAAAVGQGSELTYHALPCGTALRFSRRFLLDLGAGRPVAPDAEPWAAYLRVGDGLILRATRRDSPPAL